MPRSIASSGSGKMVLMKKLEGDKMKNWLQCCMSEEYIQKRALRKSIRKYEETKFLASFANLALKPDKKKKKRRRQIAQEMEGYGRGNISSQIFSYRELSAATKKFHLDFLIGEGGFGKVYKGHLQSKNIDVAVKELDRNGFQGSREFLVEVLMLSLLHHPNLVNLVGYCCEGKHRVLVYEYMANGSLEDHLLERGPGANLLDWDTRMKIAVGAAKGLEYLHERVNPPVIYRDLKASNILLDKDFNVKLSDFGFAKLGKTMCGDKEDASARIMGTFGYCAPEYASDGKLTTMSDVYSFGVVFLEIITGRRVIDTSRPLEEHNLLAWAEPLLKDRKQFQKMADTRLEGKYPMKGLCQALAVAVMCLQEEASDRPLMSEVVSALEFISRGDDGRDPPRDHQHHHHEDEDEDEEEEDDEAQKPMQRSMSN